MSNLSNSTFQSTSQTTETVTTNVDCDQNSINNGVDEEAAAAESTTAITVMNMFTLKKMQKLSEGTKALIYIMWKIGINGKIGKSATLTHMGSVDKVTIDSELSHFNTLEFDWTLLPKHVFHEIFEKFTYDQLCYICGCMGVQFDPKLMRKSIVMASKVNTQLINKLWDHMLKRKISQIMEETKY